MNGGKGFIGWFVFALLAALLLVGNNLRAEQAKCVLTWGKKGDKPGEFYSPIGIAINKQDEVFVTDVNNARVQKFSTDGKFLGGIGGTGTSPGQFARPHGMAMDSRGFLYIADAGNQRIQKFSISAE